MQTKYLCVLIHVWIKPSSEIFYWPFQGGTSFVDLLWVFFVLCLLCLCTCARLFICALWSPNGKGLTSWPSFVVSYCEYVTFPLVSWVRCGTWLYRFLIFAPLLTLQTDIGIPGSRLNHASLRKRLPGKLDIKRHSDTLCSLLTEQIPLFVKFVSLQQVRLETCTVT